MLLIPAIDLKDGQCVRLKQGDMDQVTTFGEDPAAMARIWVDKGARRLHLVDLNGAFAGKPKNEQAIRKILKEVGSEVEVQLGGGIRDLEALLKFRALGADRCGASRTAAIVDEARRRSGLPPIARES